jgi:predicted nuclease of predicted toxin-antitoxin system
MRIKLDENLPTRLVSVLADLGHDVDTVPTERIAGEDDAVVWQAAQAGHRFLVTQDLDFSDIRKYTPGTHHGLLLVRLPQPGRTALFERIAALFQIENVESWDGCLVIATPNKVRVRRPPADTAGERRR